MRKVLIWLLGLMTAGIAAIVAWLVVAPPDLLRVGDGYAAKIVCSNVFIAGRMPMKSSPRTCRHRDIRFCASSA